MKVPVTVNVDKATKKWTVEVGIPSAAALILKEAGIQKGSGTSGATWVGDITTDSVVKVAKLKIDSSYALNIKSSSKEIIGTCLALGVKINGKNPKEATVELESGKWDDKFK
jgi:large subunit ribosomal protein L11